MAWATQANVAFGRTRLVVSYINDEASTGRPTAWATQANVAFGRTL